MQTKIKKWGDSLAIRIPSKLIRDMGLAEDTDVEISLDADKIVIKPIRKYTLDDLLEQVTDDNIHDEIDFGKPVSKEIKK